MLAFQESQRCSLTRTRHRKLRRSLFCIFRKTRWITRKDCRHIAALPLKACLPALLHGWPGLEFPLGPGRRRGIVHACHAPALLREAVVSQSEERPLCLSKPSVKWCMLACTSTRSSARHRLAHNSSHSWRKGRLPWLAMLSGHLTNTTDAHQLNRLRTAERTTSLIVLRTAGSSLIYMNGCELSTFE